MNTLNLKRILVLTSVLALAACSGGSRNSRPATNEEMDENAAELNVQLGVGYMRQGNNALAREKLERALQLNPRLPSAHSTVAILYEQTGEVGLADDHHRQALRYSDDNPNMQNNYGAFLCRQGRYEDSLAYFVAAAERPGYTTPVAAWGNAGACARRGGLYERAETYLRRALDLDQNFADALWNMAQLSFQLDRALATRGFLQRLAAVNRLSAPALWLGYQAERALGDTEGMRNYATRLRRDFPDAPETQRMIDLEGDERGG